MLSREAALQVSEDLYHTEFISLHKDNFLFFSTREGGSDAWWKIPLIFFSASEGTFIKQKQTFQIRQDSIEKKIKNYYLGGKSKI